MNLFGFSTDNKETKPLVIKDIAQIGAYKKVSPILLKKGSVVFLPAPFDYWLFVASEKESFHQFGALPKSLPPGTFRLQEIDSGINLQDVYLGWGLGHYQFNKYITSPKSEYPCLFTKDQVILKSVKDILSAIYLTRDLINTPPNDMGPFDFKDQATELLKNTNASLTIHEVLPETWPAVFAVGMGSNRSALVLEIDWNPQNIDPKFYLGLAGKGICFDTGGYNLKPGRSMDLMKKDMAGGAQALALTKLIIDANLPIRVKTIIPLAENSISGKAFRPSDVIRTKKGITVEVGDTDAEGRLVLSDALHELCQSKPDLIIDFATLTGAARVALGPDLPAVFSNHDNIARELVAISHSINDSLWHMPLWSPYKEMLSSKVADMNNVASSSYAGAIIAALFLNEFISKEIPWIHIDFMGWNTNSKPARPEGGEAIGLRATFEFIKKKAENALP